MKKNGSVSFVLIKLSGIKWKHLQGKFLLSQEKYANISTVPQHTVPDVTL